MESQVGESQSATIGHTEPTALLAHGEPRDWASETLSSSTVGTFDEESIEEVIIVDSNNENLRRLGSTISARASVFEYIQENGRTYHRYRQGRYQLPNDEAEQDRLDLQHHLWLLTLHGRLNLAPVEDKICRVLDIGTGTGIWAIDYAMEHPLANVVGCDLSPIQPDLVPPNCVFEVDDFEDEWTYEQKFDLVHGRTLLSCFDNLKKVFEQAFKHLNPGGWFEMQDGDFPARCADDSYTGTAFEQWNNHILAGSSAMGRQLTIAGSYKRLMEEVGFVNVQERIYQCPINTWPQDPHLRDVGLYFQANLSDLVTSLKAPLTRGLGWSATVVEVFLVQVRKDIKNRNIHAYYNASVTFTLFPHPLLEDKRLNESVAMLSMGRSLNRFPKKYISDF